MPEEIVNVTDALSDASRWAPNTDPGFAVAPRFAGSRPDESPLTPPHGTLCATNCAPCAPSSPPSASRA